MAQPPTIGASISRSGADWEPGELSPTAGAATSRQALCTVRRRLCFRLRRLHSFPARFLSLPDRLEDSAPSGNIPPDPCTIAKRKEAAPIKRELNRATGLVQNSVRDSSRYCPTCSTQLREHRCKISCPQCGFYLSCSDFY